MTYKVDWTMHSAGASAIGSATGTMDSMLGDINKQTNALKAIWGGDAADAYGQLQDQWNKASENIKQALTAFQSGMNKVAGIQQDTETQNKNTFV